MATLIADWSMYQADFHGDPHSLADLYDPAKWTVSIDFAAACAGLAGVVIRVGIGTRKDPTFDRYLAGLKAAGIPFGIYHAYWPGDSATGQAQLVGQWCPETPPLGVWGDLEAGDANYHDANQYLVVLDSHYAARAGIYSGGPYLNSHFDAAEQAAWSVRGLWIAGYPNFIPPYGWDAGAAHTWHQYTDKYQLPGMTHLCDMSRERVKPMTSLTQTRGCLFGGHAQSTSSIIPIYKSLAARGAPPAIILADENPGLCMDCLPIGVPTRIARFHHPETGPDHDFESGGAGRSSWPQDMRLRFARASIALPFNHMNLSEGAAVTHVQCLGNEWDAQDVGEWLATLDVLALALDERDNRAAEYTAKYGHGLALALPVFNAGTPKTWAMYVAISQHPIWARMQAAGDVLTCHEGIFFNQPFTEGENQPPDGSAPLVSGAGLTNFRIYNLLWLLEQRGIHINWAVTEWYDGRAPRGADLEARVDNMIRHDLRLAASPFSRYCLGYCCFELTDDTSSPWYPQDATLIWEHPRWQAHVISQAGRINGTGDDEMQALYHAKALIDLALRDTNGNPVSDPLAAAPTAPGLAGVVRAGTLLHIYSVGATAGPYSNRAVVTPDGKSVWGVTAALQKV